MSDPKANDVVVQMAFPKVPQDLSSIVKPEELVDIVEMTPLTLQDRRIYNLLIGNAWNQITNNRSHSIARQELTKYIESNNQDIKASLRRLMAAIVVIKIRNNKNGTPATRQIQLLGSNETEDFGKAIHYSFPPELVDIIKNTQIFARLHTKVMFELSSKYSLALYEFLQKRKNLQFVKEERLSVEETRALLGVEKNKLKSFGHFNDKALKPALKEVSFLTEYEIKAETIKTGRAISHIQFSWQKKSNIGDQIAAVEELERSKIGRSARMNQSITSSQKGDRSEISKSNSSLATSTKTLFPDLLAKSQLSANTHLLLSASAIERAKQIILSSNQRLDVYALEAEFKEHAQKTDFKPDNVEGAFVNFVKHKIK